MHLVDLIWHQKLNRPYKLHVTQRGDRSQPTIVFLHGIAASTEDWNKFEPLFIDKYHCVFIDLLGFGQSPKPVWATYDMQTHMRSLYHTMNTLRLPKTYTLVGHSLGSFLAARYALEHERNVERLLLLSPPVYPTISTITSGYARRLTGALLGIYRILRSEKMTPATFRRLSLLVPLPKSVVSKPDTWVPFMRTLQHCIEEQTILYDVRHIRTPTDVFYGSLDQVVINANVERLAAYKHVRLHTFVGTHELSARYARKVLGVLPTTIE